MFRAAWHYPCSPCSHNPAVPRPLTLTSSLWASHPASHPCVPCRELELQRGVLTAQLSAQAAAIQQEREALMAQRINTDMLANLSEQVGARVGLAARGLCIPCTVAGMCLQAGLPQCPASLRALCLPCFSTVSMPLLYSVYPRPAGPPFAPCQLGMPTHLLTKHHHAPWGPAISLLLAGAWRRQRHC
jgi:hypothetical protein